MEHEMKDVGSFSGHIGPALGFIIYGFLWTYNNLFRYHAARKEALLHGRDARKFNYRSSLFSKYHDSSSCAVAEPCMTVIIGVLGILAEVYVIIFLHNPVVVGIHHILMYFFYAFIGLCAIAKHYKYVVPPSAIPAVFLVSNVAEGYLFTLHKLTGISQKMHLSMAFFAFMTALCGACEMVYRRSIVAALGRTLSFLAQGFWFCTTAFILYPLPIMPKWEVEEHIKMETATVLVVVTIVVVLLIAVVMSFVASQRVKKLTPAAIIRIVSFSRDANCSSISISDSEKQSFLDPDDGI